MGYNNRKTIVTLQKKLMNREDMLALSVVISVLISIPCLVFLGNTGSSMQMVFLYIGVALTLAVVYVLYMCLTTLTAKIKAFGWLESTEHKKYICISLLISAACCGFVLKEHVFSAAGRGIPVHGAGAYITLSFLYIIYSLVIYRAVMTGTYGKLFMIVSAVFASVLIFCYTYLPNIVNAQDFERVHYTAIEHSVYNTAFNQSFTMENSSIYGHYAIFFWPLVKLFGHKPQFISVLFFCGNMITEAALIYVICMGTKNNILRGIAVLCSASFVGGSAWDAHHYYGGIYPIRAMFPMLILAYAVSQYEAFCDGNKRRIFLGYVICGLALTCNIDSGAVATFAYTLYICIIAWRKYSGISKDTIKAALLAIIGCVFSLLVMIAIINIYNISVGGGIIFRECFFPLVGTNGTSIMASLQTEMSESGLQWLVPVLIFTVAVAVGLYWFMKDKTAPKADRTAYILVCSAVMGMGQCYYFLNRSLASWYLVCFYLCLCLAIAADHGFSLKIPTRLYHYILKSVGVASLCYLCVFSINIFLGAPALLNATINTELNSMDSMKQLAEQVRAVVPKDTYAFGRLTQELYAYMGWDPGYHQRDAIIMEYDRDMLEGYSEAVAEINSQSSLLVEDKARGFISPDSGLILTTQIPREQPVFYYYAKSLIYSFPDLAYSDKEALSSGNDRAILHPGVTQYGPYDPLDAGHYHVEIKGRNLDKCSYDVVYNVGATPIETTLLQQTSDTIAYEFDLAESVTNIEYRTFNKSQEDAEIVSITITH